MDLMETTMEQSQCVNVGDSVHILPVLFTLVCVAVDTVVDCGEPDEPTEGAEALNITFDTTFLDSVAVYSCDSGFIRSGMEQRVCMSNGNWSGTPAQCLCET